MCQYFQLVNVDNGQFIYLGNGRYHDFGLFPCLAKLPSNRDKSDIGSWAGGRLITIGDYMKECPVGMLTKEEEEELNEWLDERSTKFRSSFYDFVEQNFSRRDDQDPLSRPVGTFVLRNLSKQVYVHEENFFLYQRNQGVQETWGFDELIINNTSYQGFDIIPGPWAGDRFDIVMLEKVDAEYWEDVTIQEAERAAKKRRNPIEPDD